MSEQSANPLTDGPADPEHDTTAAYGLDRSYVAALTRRVVSTTGETHAVSSPIGGAPLGHVPQSGPTDVAEAFARARHAQAAWAATSVDERAAALLRLHDLLLDRQDELIDLVSGRRARPARTPTSRWRDLALTARYYARTAHQHLDAQRVGGMFPVLTRAEVHRVPKGVVGVISPWNYPLTWRSCDAIPALLAGNAVVAKPDRADVADRAAAASTCWTRPASRASSGRSCRDRARSSARRSSPRPTT